MSGWGFWVVAAGLPLLLTELAGWADWLANRIVLRAARRLEHPLLVDRYTEEFAATVGTVPGQLSRLAVAISILAASRVLSRALKAEVTTVPERRR